MFYEQLLPLHVPGDEPEQLVGLVWIDGRDVPVEHRVTGKGLGHRGVCERGGGVTLCAAGLASSVDV